MTGETIRYGKYSWIVTDLGIVQVESPFIVRPKHEQ